MCGIVGVVGNTNATDILTQGLEKLEYRGYDSAGIFVAGDASSQLVKAVGRIAELAAKLENLLKKMVCQLLKHSRKLFTLSVDHMPLPSWILKMPQQFTWQKTNHHF